MLPTPSSLPQGSQNQALSNLPIHIYSPDMISRVSEMDPDAPIPAAIRKASRKLAEGVGCGSVPISEQDTIKQKKHLGGAAVTTMAWGDWPHSPCGVSAAQAVHEVGLICEDVRERFQSGKRINAAGVAQVKRLLDFAIMLLSQYKHDIVLTIGSECGTALSRMTVDPMSESNMTYDGHLADFAFTVNNMPFSGIVVARPGKNLRQRKLAASYRLAKHMASTLRTKRDLARGTTGNSTHDITEPCFTVVDERIYVYFAHIDLVSDDHTVRLVGPFENPETIGGCELETIEGPFQTLQVFINALKSAMGYGHRAGSLG